MAPKRKSMKDLADKLKADHAAEMEAEKGAAAKATARAKADKEQSLENQRVVKLAKWQEEELAKEKEQELGEKQAAEKALQDARQKIEEEKRTKDDAEKNKRENEEAEKVRKEQARRGKELVEEANLKKAQEQREADARFKTEEAANVAEDLRRRRQEEEADKIKKAKELEEQTRRAQEQRDAEAEERDRILLSTPVITSVSPRQRPLSLESISSAFSSNDDHGSNSSSSNISVQGASQGLASLLVQEEQEDCLHERERVNGIDLPRNEEQLKSVEASQALTNAYPMHERFCFPAENVYFLVQGVLYSVHRYFFERDSSSFVGQGLSQQEPMVLANVSTHDFDLFLSILYPTTFGAYPASTVEEWSGILYLADKWSFHSIRSLAIAQIAPIASPIDKIVFGRLYDINEWLTSAYHAVCARLDALTLEEGRRLGVDDVIRINAIRQDFCFVTVSPSKLFEEDVESRFGLAVQTEHSSSRKSVKDVANRLKPDTAAKATSKKEKAARAAEIGRKSKEREAADKKAKDLKDTRAQEQREVGAKSKKEADAKAAMIEQKRMEQQVADKKAKDLEDTRHEQCEVETNSKEDGKAKAAMKDNKKNPKKNTGKAKATAAISRIYNISIVAAANEEEGWSQLTPFDRYWRKKEEIEKERDAEQHAEALKQARKQLAVEAKGAEEYPTQQCAGGTNSVSVTDPNDVSGDSKTSMSTAANGKDGWSYLTPSDRYEKKLGKLREEKNDEEHALCAAKRAEALKEAQQQPMADEALKATEAAAAQQGPGSCDTRLYEPDPHVCS